MGPDHHWLGWCFVFVLEEGTMKYYPYSYPGSKLLGIMISLLLCQLQLQLIHKVDDCRSPKNDHMCQLCAVSSWGANLPTPKRRKGEPLPSLLWCTLQRSNWVAWAMAGCIRCPSEGLNELFGIPQWRVSDPSLSSGSSTFRSRNLRSLNEHIWRPTWTLVEGYQNQPKIESVDCWWSKIDLKPACFVAKWNHTLVEHCSEEYLYKDEFEGYVKEGVLTMHTAFSREQASASCHGRLWLSNSMKYLMQLVVRCCKFDRTKPSFSPVNQGATKPEPFNLLS